MLKEITDASGVLFLFGKKSEGNHELSGKFELHYEDCEPGGRETPLPAPPDPATSPIYR
jgi:hypothetical protein